MMLQYNWKKIVKQRFLLLLVGNIAFFIIAAYLLPIRFEAAFLMLLIVFPLFIPDIIKRQKLVFNKSVVLLLVAIALSFICKYIDYQSYQKDKTWSYYQQYNKVRGQINDNPNASKIFNYLPSGVTYTDYILLLSFFSDSKVINLNKITLINKELKQVNYRVKTSNIYQSLRKYTVFVLLLFFLWSICFRTCNNTTNRVVLLFSLVIFLSALCFVSLEGELKYRVFLSAVLPFLLVLFSNFQDTENILFKKIIAFCLCCFALLFSYQSYNIQKLSSHWRDTNFKQQYTLLNNYLQNKNNAVISFASSFNIEYYAPFEVSKLFNKNQIYFAGWLTNIPLNKNKFDSYLDLIKGKAIFCSKNDTNQLFSLINKSIILNYGLSVKIKIELASKDYEIVKFIPKSKYQMMKI
jgi:hypothetical protein